tara:strand:+ start:216 stop:395 length:180 start_codon:yes stop_codon:yes gene_type:complete
MSPSSDPRYFGKSALNHLRGVTDAVKGVLSGESQNEEKTSVEPQTEPKEKETLKESDNG